MKLVLATALFLASFQASAATKLMNEIFGSLLNGQTQAEFYGKTHDRTSTVFEMINGVQQPAKQVQEGRDCKLTVEEFKDGLFRDFKVTVAVEGLSVDLKMDRGIGGVNPDEVSWRGWDHKNEEVRAGLKLNSEGKLHKAYGSKAAGGVTCFFDDK